MLAVASLGAGPDSLAGATLTAEPTASPSFTKLGRPLDSGACTQPISLR